MMVNVADCFEDRRRENTEGLIASLFSFMRETVGHNAVVSILLDGAIIEIGRKESAIFGDDFRCVFDNDTGDSFVEGNLMSAYNWFDRSDCDDQVALTANG